MSGETKRTRHRGGITKGPLKGRPRATWILRCLFIIVIFLVVILHTLYIIPESMKVTYTEINSNIFSSMKQHLRVESQTTRQTTTVNENSIDASANLLTALRAELDETRKKIELQKETSLVQTRQHDAVMKQERENFQRELDGFKIKQKAQKEAYEKAQRLVEQYRSKIEEQKSKSIALPTDPKIKNKIEGTQSTINRLQQNNVSSSLQNSPDKRERTMNGFLDVSVPWGFTGPEVVLWLKADKGVVLIPNTHNTLSVWKDQSGDVGSLITHDFISTNRSSRNAISGSKSLSGAPTLVQNARNDLPAVDFPCAMISESLRLRDEMTFFAVIRPRNIKESGQNISGEGERFFGTYPNGQFRFHKGQPAFFGIEKVALPDDHSESKHVQVGNWFLAKYRFNQSIEMAVNKGAFHESWGVGGPTGLKRDIVFSNRVNEDTKGVTLGGVRGRCGFDGMIGEILLFGSSLSDSESSKVARYLAHKWNLGFSDSKPAEHRVSAAEVNQLHKEEALRNKRDSDEINNLYNRVHNLENDKSHEANVVSNSNFEYTRDIASWKPPETTSQNLKERWAMAVYKFNNEIHALNFGGERLNSVIREKKKMLESLRDEIFG